jgi:hypothetical protein
MQKTKLKINMKNLKIFVLATILTSIFIGGIYFSRFLPKQNKIPDYARRTEEVKLAYEFALSNPEVLTKIPCYCGCDRLGHQSVENCFVKEFKKDGGVVFEKHGAYCGMCYSIVLETKELFEQGKNISEIRQYIDNKYSKYGGQPTNTPL